MATVKLHKAATPTDQVLEEANRTFSVTDARGRVIGFRRLKMSDQRRILKALSNESASKEKYLGMIMLAACVISIDGEEIRFPANELQFDALIDRLETDGFTAIATGVQKEFGITDEDVHADAGE